MRRALLVAAAVGMLALSAWSVEVRLRDGTVIEAASYTLTGSYLMVELADGRKVAYDVADVDVEALRAAEPPPRSAEGERPSETTLSGAGRGLAMPAEGGSGGGLAITDQDVAHVKRSGQAEAGEEPGEEAAAEGGPPPGYQQGGGVVIDNLRVTAQGEDRWLVEGEVINRSPDPVLNVRVQLQTIVGAGETPWSGEVEVASMLPPDEKGVFSHGFEAPTPENKAHPDVRASVIWMQQQARGPARPTGAQGVPRVPGPLPTPED